MLRGKWLRGSGIQSAVTFLKDLFAVLFLKHQERIGRFESAVLIRDAF